MAAFSTVKLADCVDLLAGFAFKSQHFTDKPDDVALVKGENVSQGCILWEISKRWPAADWPNLEKFQLRSGDVIVAMDRPWVPAGLKWAYIRRDDPKALLVQRCSRLRRNTPSLDQDFLRFVIGSPGFESYVIPITTGVNVPHISGKQILDYEFALPPLSSQKRIVGILSAYDELIENSQRRIKILEAMASVLYREWFLHFRFPGHENHPRVPSPLGEIPQGWDLTTFAQAAFFENGDRGKNYPNGSDFVDEGIPFINAGHLVDGAVDHAGMNYVLEEKFGQLRSGKIRKGDILFCLRGSPGRTARTAEVSRGAIASSLVIIRPTDRANEAFLYYTLVGEVGKRMATELNNGAAQPNVSVGSVQKYPLLLPSMDLLREFAKSIEPIWKHIEILRNQLSNLKGQRNLLMPRLLSGQI